MIAGIRVNCDKSSHGHSWHEGTFVIGDVDYRARWYDDKERTVDYDEPRIKAA